MAGNDPIADIDKFYTLFHMLRRWVRSFLKDGLTLGIPALGGLLALETFNHGYAFALELLPFYALGIFGVLALKSV